jgi:hypothetical protein
VGVLAGGLVVPLDMVDLLFDCHLLFGH